jgi:hypothetical protein
MDGWRGTPAAIHNRLVAMLGWTEPYYKDVASLLLRLALDGCITKAPCGGQTAGPSPVDRRKQGLKRSTVTEAHGIPLGAVPAEPTVATTGCWRTPWTPWS